MSTPHYHSTLRIINSRTDLNGNRYWAFEFIDHMTGVGIVARFGGGASNIEAIRYGWSTPKEYDRGILTEYIEKPIREFNRHVKGLPYAGSDPDDIRAFIRGRLNEFKTGQIH